MRCYTCSRLIKEGCWRLYQGIATWVCRDCAAYLKPVPKEGPKKTGPGDLGTH
jgi:hypothetical protein